MLDKEFKYYKDHQDELVERYNGKFIAIVETTIKGPFDTELESYLVMKKDYPVGTFLSSALPPRHYELYTDVSYRGWSSRQSFVGPLKASE